VCIGCALLVREESVCVDLDEDRLQLFPVPATNGKAISVLRREG
jgi:hypothetical protein